jgi:hypothetical protein
LALLVAVAAIGYAWKLSRELATAQRRLDRYNKALFDANDEIRRLREEVADGMARLRVDMMKGEGEVRFRPEMTVREAKMVHGQAEEVLAGYHLGGCDDCAVESDETLAQICAAHGVDEQGLLANLNTLLANGSELDTAAGAPRGFSPPRVKLPNVAVEW